MRWIWVLVAVGCGSEPEAVLDDWVAPDQPGSYTVGTSEATATTWGELELPVQLWYPASRVVDAPYAYEGIVEGGAQLGLEADCEAPRPVVVFSHGNGGIRTQSYFLTEHLAAHGYVVVAPEHIGSSLWDGTLPRGEAAVRRPLDVRAAFDAAVALSADPEHLLAGCVDPQAGYAVIGHSFGGFTSLAVSGARVDLEALDAACADGQGFLCGAAEAYRAWMGDEDGDLSDPRIWASFPIAPASQPGLDVSTVRVPTMVIGGLDDELTTWDDQVQPTYAGLVVSPRHLVGFERTGHFTFTNFCWVDPTFNGCGPESMDADVVHAAVNVAVQAFLDVLRGEARAAAWLPVDQDGVIWQQG